MCSIHSTKGEKEERESVCETVPVGVLSFFLSTIAQHSRNAATAAAAAAAAGSHYKAC